MELIKRVARAIAANLGEQDYGEAFQLRADLKLDYIDQGETDFGELAKAAIRAVLDGVEPVAVLRFNHDLTSEHNEMPKVVSCIWQADGEHMVYSLDALKEAVKP